MNICVNHGSERVWTFYVVKIAFRTCSELEKHWKTGSLNIQNWVFPVSETRHGEWRDIALLVSLAERPVAGVSLISGYYNSDALNAIAEAIHTIGKGHLGTLLVHPMPVSLLMRILERASERDFVSLGDEEILTQLSSASDEIRIVAAMKSIRALPRKRLSRLFDRYLRLGSAVL